MLDDLQRKRRELFESGTEIDLSTLPSAWLTEDFFNRMEQAISLRLLTLCETCDTLFPSLSLNRKYCAVCRDKTTPEQKAANAANQRRYRRNNYEKVRAIERKSHAKGMEGLDEKKK